MADWGGERWWDENGSEFAWVGFALNVSPSADGSTKYSKFNHKLLINIDNYYSIILLIVRKLL